MKVNRRQGLDPQPERSVSARLLISPANAWILGGFLAMCLVIGSFFDLQISEALVNPNDAFGVFGAAYGEYPFSLALLVGGMMLIMFRSRQRTGLALIQIALGILALVVGGVMTVVNPNRYLPGAPVWNYLLNALIVGAVVWATIYLLRGVERSQAMRVATVVLLVVVAELIIINVIKVGWERPRMRMLLEQPDAVFSPWWNPGTPEKSALMAAGVGPKSSNPSLQVTLPTPPS